MIAFSAPAKSPPPTRQPDCRTPIAKSLLARASGFQRELAALRARQQPPARPIPVAESVSDGRR